MNFRIFTARKVLGIISAVIVVFFVTMMVPQHSQVTNSTYTGPPKAVIIDQLYDQIPNEYFTEQATKYLETGGYEVDIFTTEDVTVDFFKNLPSMNYQFIVVRTHGAAEKNKDSVVLFTGERYQEDKYISEQLFGEIKRGTPLQQVIITSTLGNTTEVEVINSTAFSFTSKAHVETRATDEYFVVTPKLVKDLMVGTFPGSVFILGGCNTMQDDSMARSLIERGATTVVGWDDSVSNIDNDESILLLLEEVLVNNMEVGDAVDFVRTNFKITDGYSSGILKHYSNGDL